MFSVISRTCAVQHNCDHTKCLSVCLGEIHSVLTTTLEVYESTVSPPSVYHCLTYLMCLVLCFRGIFSVSLFFSVFVLLFCFWLFFLQAMTHFSIWNRSTGVTGPSIKYQHENPNRTVKYHDKNITITKTVVWHLDIWRSLRLEDRTVTFKCSHQMIL